MKQKKSTKRRVSATKHNKKSRFPSILLGRARFLPAIAIAVFATFIALQPATASLQHHGVLAYATNVSPAGLLEATNQQRVANGVGSLDSNGTLNAAAQAKANDMVARDYWAHVTPDGKQPWDFISNVGYSYSNAGENLAYGFADSSGTITGWMNSPPHKHNLLSTNFTQVGFGIANSENFVTNGHQTIVVAMYASPLQSSAPIKSTPIAARPAPKPAATPAPAPVSAKEEAKPTETPAPVNAEPIDTASEPQTSQSPVLASETKIQRVQLLTNGWLGASAVVLAVLAAMLLWAIHKGVKIGRYVLSGEQFVKHHLHVDFAVLAIVYLSVALLSTSGAVR